MDFEQTKSRPTVGTKALQEAAIKSLQNPGKGDPLPKTDKTNKPILYLFRHCQTKDNLRRIFSGRRQTSLTEKGWEQAKSLAELLKNKEIDLFISPPTKRCIQTLEPLKTYFPDVPHEQRKEIVERDYGDLLGKSKMTIMKRYPEQAVLWRRSWDVAPPHGESLKQVWEQRIQPFCKWLENKMKTEKINVAYCGTNNTVRLIRWYFEKFPQDKMLVLETSYGDYASYSLV